MDEPNESVLISETIRQLGILRFAYGFSLILFAVVARIGHFSGEPNGILERVLQVMAVAVLIVGYLVRRYLLSEHGVMNRTRNFQGDPQKLAKYYKQVNLATYAACDLIGLFGLVVVASGFEFERSIAFFVLGLLALVIFRPKRIELENIIAYGKYLAS